MAKEIKYNHNSKTIAEIQNEVEFTVLTPTKIPDDWTLDIKTSPWLMLHYMDSKDTNLMVSIHLRKGTRVLYDGSPHSKQVDINGNIGYFSEWGNSGKVDQDGELITGGLLRWAQDGTSIEMLSYSLSKNQIIRNCKVNEITLFNNLARLWRNTRRNDQTLLKKPNLKTLKKN
ncbi:DUF4367 domain-containing protein [Ureibacillus sinduriensis]|uniref:DUF4367 domain-containing protein n=1 Tax=Ureibacillus sinduriensis TaxID=561440 RepID=UPI000B00268D|nr:DUF4367 domain-containing protein [Ureibacillus sinduriensis]